MRLLSARLALQHMPIDPDTAHQDGATSLWVPVGMSLLAGVSTTLGGAVVLALDGAPSAEVMAGSLALAGAVMVTVSLEMVLPVFWFEAARLAEAAACFVAGACCFFAMQRLLGHDHDHGPDEHLPLTKDVSAKEHWRLGLLMMATLSAHNFPEGLAVAVSAMDSHDLGIVVAVAIAMHNIPEGIVISVPIYAATRSKAKAITYALVSGLAEPLGALLAVLVLRPWVTPRVLGNMLAAVAGVMISISVVELFPHALRYERPVACCVGTALGVLVMVLTGMLV